MKVLALDYGSARTGLAISDASGALARPLTFVERIGTPAGLDQLLSVITEEQPELLLVGLPVLSDGTRGAQANATLAFVGRLRAVCAVPIEFEDERFTSRIAETKGGASSLDDRAAAVLLQGWLDTHHNQ
jgi:putative Holliday junction resolvase